MRVIREPLFHFLVLGAVIFGVHSLVAGHRTNAPGEIVVTRGAIENLVTGFTRTWQRPPTRTSFKGWCAITSVKRPATARRSPWDSIGTTRLCAAGSVRSSNSSRRIWRPGESRTTRNCSNISTQIKPRFRPSHACRSPNLLRFSEAWERAPGRDASVERLRQVGPGIEDREHGDPFLLAPTFDAVMLSDLKNTFGEAFALAVGAVPVESWQGPIDSGYGTHLVYVETRTDSRRPPLSEVREQVRREYLDAKRKRRWTRSTRRS